MEYFCHLYAKIDTPNIAVHSLQIQNNYSLLMRLRLEYLLSKIFLYFFVFQNPELSVDESDAMALNYITYIGSALSVFFTIISLIIYIYLQWDFCLTFSS